MNFNVGDQVITPLGEGVIEELLDEDYAAVSFTGDLGGGFLPFSFEELAKKENEIWI